MAQPIEVIGGIDTHTDFHQAAVIDTIGRHLATEAFPTTPAGYRRLLEWLRSHGQVLVVGMEGTGSFGAELARYLHANQVSVIEVDRPDRRARRAAGKSDPVDAYAAATAVFSGRAKGTPKHRDGSVEAIRGLRVVRASAVKARTQTINQIKSLIITAPAAVREALRSLTTTELIRRLAASRPGADLTDPAAAVKLALKRLAKRYRHLSEEIADADADLHVLIARTAPACSRCQALGPRPPGSCWSPPGTTPTGSSRRHPSPTCALPHLCQPLPGAPTAIDSTVVVTARPTERCTQSCWSACVTTDAHVTTSHDALSKGSRRRTSSDASSASSRERSTATSRARSAAHHRRPQRLDDL